MPITSTDLKFHLSGGAANSDPNAALGGAISTTQIVDATVANLFDNVSSAESAAGDTEYRCFYVKNTHATLTLQAAKVYIQTNTPSADTSAEIGLGTSAVNGTEQTVANESTAPSAVTFSTAAGSGKTHGIQHFDQRGIAEGFRDIERQRDKRGELIVRELYAHLAGDKRRRKPCKHSSRLPSQLKPH